MCGIKQELALKLSFLMSAPAVLGAVVLFDVWKMATLAPTDAAIMIVSSLIAGYATMSILLRFAGKVNFAIFCVSLGGLTLLFSQLSILF
jgi:undecaprenyl-diphosphatase